MLKIAFFVLLAVAAATSAPHPDKKTLLRAKHVAEALKQTRQAKHAMDAGLSHHRNGFQTFAYEEQIFAFLETLKETMRSPIAALGNRTLDPLQIDELNLDIDNDLIALQGNLQDVTVNDLSQFQPVAASFSIVGFSLSVEIFLSDIYASGSYNMTGSLVSDLLPIYGDGLFTAAVRNISLSVVIALQSEGEIPYIASLDIDYNIPIVETSFQNLLGGGDLGDVTNEIISDLVPEILDTYKESILGVLEPAIISIANEALSGFTLEGLICIVVGLFC